MKCANKESAGAPLFEPESPNVIICEGWQDASLICALLEHLDISNCDVTYPTKAEGANGKTGIKNSLYLLSAHARTLNGVLVIGDADGNPELTFQELCDAFCDPFKPPPQAHKLHSGKHHKTAIYLIPGKGKTGALEHLLLEAVNNVNATGVHCIEQFRACVGTTADWSANKLAKMRLACYVASHCKNDPCCSPAYLWSSKNKLFDLSNTAFEELSEFLLSFSSGEESE